MIGPDSSASLYSFENLWRQYRACRRNKRNTLNALAFEIDAEAKLLELQRELREHTYRPGRSICFVTGGPKPREVFAADFRDRVVHHLLVSYQERAFEPRFIDDSYACRKGKGALAASDRLMEFLRRITTNGRRPAWALGLDVASFFPSMHKETLYRVIARRIRDPEVLWLTRVLLFHDPTMDYRFRALDGRKPPPGDPRYPIPARKSLFGKHNERGLPIGNLTSQFWGNVYLNEIDHFVKRRLGCRYYVRYVDDLVLLAEEPQTLLDWSAAIERYLAERLLLAPRAGPMEPFPVSRGVDFVGWKTWWSHRLVRRRTSGSLVRVLDRFERRAVRPAFGGGTRRINLSSSRERSRIEGLRATLASYSGHLRQGAAWQDWTRAWERHPWLAILFARREWRIAARWPRPGASVRGSFGDQYRALTRNAGDNCLVFFRVGRFFEFYGGQRLIAQRVLGLRSFFRPRAGYAFTAGFPIWLLSSFIERAVSSGNAALIVREDRRDTGARLTRRPALLLLPPLSPVATTR